MKIFYAPPATASPDQVSREVKLLKKVISARGTDNPRIRSGRDDHRNNWKGDWDAWQYSVVHRTDLTTQKRVYDVFMVTGPHCGRATANILRLALSLDRPVFWWDGEDPGIIRKVKEIEEDDCEDWTAGWRITCWNAAKPKQLPLPFPEDSRP